MSIINTSAPVMVSFDVTSECNLRCVHCFNNSGSSTSKADLPPLQMLEIAKQVAELRPLSCCLCGGEALCCDNLMDIIKTINTNTGRIGIVSNGWSMTAEKAIKLKESGVYLAQISLDGANPWQHDTFRGVSGSFERAVRAIGFLKEAGFAQVNVSFVPNKLNFRSLSEHARLCCSLGVSGIRAMPFLPSGRGRSIGRNLMLDAQEYFKLCRDIVRLRNRYNGRMLYEWGDPLDHMRRMPLNAQHGMTTYVMEIKSNGDLTVSTYLPVVAGNCNRHSLKEYWDSGYNHIWADERFTFFTEQIRNIYDLDSFEPKPYENENILIDIMEAAK